MTEVRRTEIGITQLLEDMKNIRICWELMKEVGDLKVGKVHLPYEVADEMKVFWNC